MSSGTNSEEDDLSYSWVDEGETQPDGTVEHEELEVKVDGSKCVIRVGDCILLNSDDESERKERNLYNNTDENIYSMGKKDGVPVDAFVARVDRMWEDPQGGRKDNEETRMKIRTTWFFKKDDVGNLPATFAGPVSRQQLLCTMTDRDLILSNQADDNDVLTILGKCTVLNRQPSQSLDPVPPLPPHTFVCRYSIFFRGSSAPRRVVLTPYDGENDDWPPLEVHENTDRKRPADPEEPETSPKRARMNEESDMQGTPVVTSGSLLAHRRSSVETPMYMKTPPMTEKSAFSLLANSSESSSSSSDSNKDDDMDTMSSDDDMSSSSFRSGDDDERPFETEGSTTVGHIHVGPEYQAVVTPFEGQEAFQRTTRNPALVWKRNSIQDDTLEQYFAKAAVILRRYLDQEEMTSEDQDPSLSTDQTEADEPAAVSPKHAAELDMSTGSQLTKSTVKLIRECNVDALMAVLHKNGYDTDAGLEALASSPQDVLTLWTPHEKELFDSGFRRHCGQLRMICKQSLGASKTFKDCVDFHYRFMIPDQFRHYKEKKRELAVRMMECIENRRHYESLAPSRSDKSSSVSMNPNVDDKKQTHDWTKISGAELIGVTEDRRVSARELLLDVKSTMGKDAMVQVAAAVKSYHSIPDLKESLVELLQDQPDLLDRFIEFLPLRFR